MRRHSMKEIPVKVMIERLFLARKRKEDAEDREERGGGSSWVLDVPSYGKKKAEKTVCFKNVWIQATVQQVEGSFVTISDGTGSMRVSINEQIIGYSKECVKRGSLCLLICELLSNEAQISVKPIKITTISSQASLNLTFWPHEVNDLWAYLAYKLNEGEQ